MDQVNETRPRLLRPRDLPLFVKLLVPFLLLILVIAAGGLFLVVRDLTTRSQAALDEELLRRSLEASSRIHDRELYLLESVNFAANLRRMGSAVESHDATTSRRLLQSVMALKPDLELVAVIDSDGRTVAQMGGARGGSAAERSWADEGFVLQSLASEEGAKAVGLPTVAGRTLLGIAAPICSETRGCAPVGVAIVGIDLETLANEAAGRSSDVSPRIPAVAVYAEGGRLLATSDEELVRRTWRRVEGTGLIRRTQTFDGKRFQTLYAPLEIRDQTVGSLAVSLPADPAFSTAQGTASRLTLLFFLAIAGVVGIGLLLTRWLLGQVRPLVETSRELEQGNLSARVPVVAGDELGELAGTLNGMAEQLQASHATLERRVDERTEEVRRLLRERTEFFAGISHELRTPIAVILVEAKMLADSQRDRKTSEAADTIIGSAEQLLARVNDILDVARAESGRLEVSLQEVALPPLFQELDRSLTALVSGSELSLTVDAPSNLPAVRADPLRLKDVLLNLVENAVKYTPAGGAVSLAAGARNGKVEISVTDSGVGIPKRVGDRIFDPFYRVPGTKPPRGGTSSGLGLALAKRVVEAQGGSIRYISRVKKGTTFTIELPRVGAASKRAQPERR